MKLKFEEAISVPESEKRSVADSIDYHTIGVFLLIYVTIVDFLLVSYSIFYANSTIFKLLSHYLINSEYIATD